MIARTALCIALIAWGAFAPPRAPAADFFYMDRDGFTNEYVGPTGPLVLSGEIAPGDYARLLDRIAADPDRFFAQNKLILASAEGNAAEAMRIARLVKSLYTEVVVGPLTGRCAGACFLVYAAAARRATDGEKLLGVSRPGLASSEWVSMPTAKAALLEDGMQAEVRAFLAENAVPPALIDAMFERPPTDVQWLTEEDEAALGARSPAFRQYLAENCGWSESVERAAYQGDIEALRKTTECRDRLTLAAARKALALALKEEHAAAAP